MTNLKYEIENIKYAMDRGFTKVEITTYKNETHFNGKFGYFVVTNEEDAKVLKEVIESYNKEKVEVLGEKLEEMFKGKAVIKNKELLKVMKNEIKEIRVIKHYGEKIFIFILEEDNKNSHIVVEQMRNGKWWVKRSTLRKK